MNEAQSGLQSALWMAQLLDRKGGLNITILDVRGLSTITDFYVIATGTSSKHMETLIDAPCQELKKLGFPAQHIEGNGTHWAIADFSDILLHVFDEQTRAHYDLEGLWKRASRIEWDSRKQTTSLKMISL